jgi:hypothetical protein
MLVGGMVEHQVEDDVQVPFMGFLQQEVKILQGAELGVDALVVGDIVAEVLVR